MILITRLVTVECVNVFKMEVKPMLSEKGKPLLLVNGHKFYFHKMLAKNVKRWTCTKALCRAYIKTEGVEDSVVDTRLEHNHERDADEIINRQMLSNKVKKKSIDIIEKNDFAQLKSSTLLHQELRNSDEDSITIQDIKRIKKNLQRARSSCFSKLIKTRQEFDESEKISIEINADHFLDYGRNSDVVVDGPDGKR